MTSRNLASPVTFDRPFAIPDVPGIHAGGQYEVETEDKLVSGLSFPVWQRGSISPRLPPTPADPGLEQVVLIDAAALEALLQGREAAPDPPALGFAAPLRNSRDEGPRAMVAGRSEPVRRSPWPHHPIYRNDGGSADMAIGVTDFACTGAAPPEDHPRIQLRMDGLLGAVLCPYCATRFRHDAQLGPNETDPSGCRSPDSLELSEGLESGGHR